MAWKRPTPEEFNDHWLTPAESLGGDRLTTLKRDGYRRWIMDRLKSGVIVAVARTMSSPGDSPQSFALVARKYWEQWQTGEHQFWEFGDATFNAGKDISGYDQTEIRFLDVRFDPDTLTSAVPSVEITENDAPEPSQTNKKPLPSPWLDEWASVFKKANPGASEARGRASVDATFPNHTVTVRELRRVLPDRSPGRPLKTKDK